MADKKYRSIEYKISLTSYWLNISLNVLKNVLNVSTDWSSIIDSNDTDYWDDGNLSFFFKF